MIQLFLVLAVLAVVFGVGAFLTGRAEGLSDEPQDLASVGIPRDRAMTADDVTGLRFALALRGYRMDEVDDALDRLAAEIAARDEHIARLRADLDARPAREEAPRTEWDRPPTWGGGGHTAARPARPAVPTPPVVPDVPATTAAAAAGAAAVEPPAVPEPPEPPAPAEPTRPFTPVEPVTPAEPVTPPVPPAPILPPDPGTLPPLPPLPERPEPPVSTAPAWSRRSADDYVAPADDYVPSDATGDLPSDTPVDVPTTPEGWAELAAEAAEAAGAAGAAEPDPATPEFVAPPANPFRPEVPDIPTYDPWSVTPRSRYTDGPTYVEVEEEDDSDPVEGIAEHHTGHAPHAPADTTTADDDDEAGTSPS